MKTFTELRQLPASLPSPIVTIGNFDGLHLGHQQILHRVAHEARSAHGSALVITFDPHPLRILLPESAPPLIMTSDQKLAALSEFGIDYALVLPFDAELAHWSPRQFVEKILVENIAARKVLVGSNFVFGYQQRGTIETLRSLGQEFHFGLEAVPQLTWRKTCVSSTLIRGLIREGQIASANRLLGRFFSLEGLVVEGAGRGRRLTVPTLNLAAKNEVLPKSGVYVTRASIAGQHYPSVTNIGIRPTFNETHLSIESHLIDVKSVCAPDQMTLSFLHRLREEKQFSSASALKEQIRRDVSAARRFFARMKKFVPAAISP